MTGVQTCALPIYNSYVTKILQNELGKVDKRELILSVALRDNHSLLQKIAQSLVSSLAFLPLGYAAQKKRIRQLTSLIQQKHFDLDEISLLMQAADTGIQSVSLNEEQISRNVLQFMKTGSETNNKANVPNSDEAEKAVYNLEFTHDGGGNNTFNLSEESAGTLAWLSIAPTLLQTLREGTILIRSEIVENA